jgi:hypothetical protein
MGKNKIGSKLPYDQCATYKVSVVVEFYREMTVRAADSTEAMEIAEARIRARQSIMKKHGYSVGDIEVLEVEEHE